MTKPDRPAAVVALVDDDEGIRASVSMMLEVAGYRTETFASIAEFAASGAQGRIACLVLDHTLPGMSGIDFLASIAGSPRTYEVVVLTAFGTVPNALAAVRAGAFEFVEKPFDPPELLKVVAKAVAASVGRRSAVEGEALRRERLARLTEREHQILVHLLEGSATKVIAAKLEISPRTVEIHRARVMEKLDCQGPVELYREYRPLVPSAGA
jgi:two-component system response regulator FixJ